MRETLKVGQTVTVATPRKGNEYLRGRVAKVRFVETERPKAVIPACAEGDYVVGLQLTKTTGCVVLASEVQL